MKKMTGWIVLLSIFFTCVLALAEGADTVQLKPEFANDISECTDPSKLYVLPDGYIYAYMAAETVTVGDWSDNLVSTSIDTDGSVFHGIGYKEDTRLLPTGEAAEQANSVVTGFIPCTHADTIRITGASFGPTSGAGGKAAVFGYVSCYTANKTNLASVSMDTMITYGGTASGITVSNSDGTYAPDSISTITFSGVPDQMAYVRIGFSDVYDGKIVSPASLKVTKLVEDGAVVVTESWQNTGHAFVPADYEDRIIEAEADIIALQNESITHGERIAELEENGLSGSASNIIPEGLEWLNGYPIRRLTLTGNMFGMSDEKEVTLEYACEDKDGNAQSGTCTMKWQGSSSLAYEKKNYTIKFDNAFEVVDGWTAQKKYCLKANYIDHSHARNIVSCKLWGQIVKSRDGVDSRLTALPNGGAIDGFPVVVILNGEFHGLYTWNIPKDGWMYGMSDSTVQQAIICADEYTDSTAFKALAVLDGSDYTLEYCSTEDESWVLTSFNRMLQAVIDSDGSDIDTTLAQYIDINSAIDYMIDTVLVEAADCMSKNTLYVTYDGVKWFFGAYDRDSTFGLRWHGKEFAGLPNDPTFERWTTHRLMDLLWTHKREAIRARYEELRAGVMSENNVALTVWNFGSLIPKPILMKDVEKWTSIPSSSVNDINQMIIQYMLRVKLTDEWIKE